MREVSFRGKRPNHGGWVYGGITQLFNGGSVSIIVSDNGEHNFYAVSFETVGQYVGLEDKNGTEIYEGDICVSDASNMPRRFAVEWYGSGFYTSTGQRLSIYLYLPACIEVIGNIYENPELLEQS